MRKIFLISLVVIGFITAKGQGAYIKFTTGYGFPLAGESIYDEKYNSETVSKTPDVRLYNTEYDSKSLSYGKGIYVGSSFGYMITKNFGFEIGINSLIGQVSKVSYDYRYYDYFYSIDYNYNTNRWDSVKVTYLDSESGTDSYKGTLYCFNPSIVIASGMKKIDPYARFGLLVGIPKVTSQNKYIDNSNKTLEHEVQFSGGVAIGFNAALGMMFKFSKHFGMFVEANMNSLTYSPKKGEVTKYVDNGNDQLPSMTTKERKAEFSGSFTESYTAAYNSQTNEYNYSPDIKESPSKETSINFPFSSIGVNFGIIISFGSGGSNSEDLEY